MNAQAQLAELREQHAHLKKNFDVLFETARDSARELAAARAEVERLQGELKEVLEMMHRQLNAANTRILELEAANLRLKRHLSPKE